MSCSFCDRNDARTCIALCFFRDHPYPVLTLHADWAENIFLSIKAKGVSNTDLSEEEIPFCFVALLGNSDIT